MFLSWQSFSNIVLILGFMVVVFGSLYGLRIFQCTFENDPVKIFIAFTLADVFCSFYMTLPPGLFVILYAQSPLSIMSYGMVDHRNDQFYRYKPDPSYLSIYSSTLIVRTIWNGIKRNCNPSLFMSLSENSFRTLILFGLILVNPGASREGGAGGCCTPLKAVPSAKSEYTSANFGKQWGESVAAPAARYCVSS